MSTLFSIESRFLGGSPVAEDFLKSCRILSASSEVVTDRIQVIRLKGLNQAAVKKIGSVHALAEFCHTADSSVAYHRPDASFLSGLAECPAELKKILISVCTAVLNPLIVIDSDLREPVKGCCIQLIPS